MTDIAQRPATGAKRPTRFSSLEGEPLDLLELTGLEHQTVFVRKKELNGQTIAEFSTVADEWYTGGLFWASDSEHAKFITFSYDDSITGIECDLPYSVVHGTKPQLQDLAIPSAREAKITYSFWVNFGPNLRHDPKILVTPINTTGDGNARTGKA